jgi:RNA polymerase sigma factor (sigma-70 family)
MKPKDTCQRPGGVDRGLIRKLGTWLRRRERNMADAEVEDVIGSALLRFAKEPTTTIFSPEDYLRRMIINEVTERHRQRSARPHLEQWPMDAEPPNCATEVDYVNQYALQQIIDKLPKREHEVFVRNLVDGVPLTAIAKEMNVSYATAHRLLAKAIVRCKALAGRTQGDPK